MLIASKMMALRKQLDQTHQSYHSGHADLCELAQLDQQITSLLAEAKGTHFEPGLVCTQGLVRALQTRVDQKNRNLQLTAVA